MPELVDMKRLQCVTSWENIVQRDRSEAHYLVLNKRGQLCHIDDEEGTDSLYIIPRHPGELFALDPNELLSMVPIGEENGNYYTYAQEIMQLHEEITRKQEYLLKGAEILRFFVMDAIQWILKHIDDLRHVAVERVKKFPTLIRIAGHKLRIGQLRGDQVLENLNELKQKYQKLSENLPLWKMTVFNMKEATLNRPHQLGCDQTCQGLVKRNVAKILAYSDKVVDEPHMDELLELERKDVHNKCMETRGHLLSHCTRKLHLVNESCISEMRYHLENIQFLENVIGVMKTLQLDDHVLDAIHSQVHAEV